HGRFTVSRLTDDIESVVAQDLDDVETDQRLVLGDDNPSRGGGRGLLRHLLFSHGTILVGRGCAPGRRRGLPMTQKSGAPFGRTGLLSAPTGTKLCPRSLP